MNPITAYRRQLAECCLVRIKRAATAGEVLETMGELAQAEGHPRALWSGLTVQQVAGFLRAIEADGAAGHGPERPSAKRSRPDPTWQANAEACGDIPQAPEQGVSEEEAPKRVAAPTDPNKVYSPTQLRALLSIGDDMFGLVARFARELQDHHERAKRRLEEVGLL